MTKVPPRQLECLLAIAEGIRRTTTAPTTWELARLMGLVSVGTVQQHLIRLEKRGLISRAGCHSGSIHLTESGSRYLEGIYR